MPEIYNNQKSLRLKRDFQKAVVTNALFGIYSISLKNTYFNHPLNTRLYFIISYNFHEKSSVYHEVDCIFLSF